MIASECCFTIVNICEMQFIYLDRSGGKYPVHFNRLSWIVAMALTLIWTLSTINFYFAVTAMNPRALEDKLTCIWHFSLQWHEKRDRKIFWRLRLLPLNPKLLDEISSHANLILMLSILVKKRFNYSDSDQSGVQPTLATASLEQNQNMINNNKQLRRQKIFFAASMSFLVIY